MSQNSYNNTRHMQRATPITEPLPHHFGAEQLTWNRPRTLRDSLSTNTYIHVYIHTHMGTQLGPAFNT